MNKDAFEGLKETLRTAVMAVVSYLLTAGVLQALVFAALGEKLTTEWQFIFISLLTALLSGIDKWLHKADVKIVKEGEAGLVPF